MPASNRFEEVYEPDEDSWLLLNSAKGLLANRSPGKLLEVGVGSGYVLSDLASVFPQWDFSGTDCNAHAISMASHEMGKTGVSFRLEQGDLTGPFRGELFDLVLFNAPYLPYDKEDREPLNTGKGQALYGGKKGYETALRFLCEVGSVLHPDGEVLLIISSLTGYEQFVNWLAREGFQLLEEKRQGAGFFEELLLLRFSYREELQEACSKGFEKPAFLASGKHSLVLEGDHDGCESIIKIGPREYLHKEAHFLRKLQGESFVPTLFYAGEGYVVCEKVRGDTIGCILSSSPPELIKTALMNALSAARRLDELGITKFEMHHPRKHIFVRQDGAITFIDFERCIFTKKPKNTTQFLQYLRSLQNTLEERNLRLDIEYLDMLARNIKSSSMVIDHDRLLNDL